MGPLRRFGSRLVLPVRVRSFCKINLALEVLGRRADGYHEIRTVFQTIDLHDELEFHESESLDIECPSLAGVRLEENLVWKAAAALRSAASVERGARMRLRKNVPAGAGLGGGSSNAAGTLMGLSRLWELTLPRKRLYELAAALGSDVPFFLEGGTALGIGRGEEIYPLPDFPKMPLVLIFPGVQVSTAAAYASLNRPLTSWDRPHKIQAFCSRLGEMPAAGIFNDFETSVLPAHRAIREAKAFLEERGATATLLSGSGSSVFGFFPEEESALAASRAAPRGEWRVFPAKTLSRAEFSNLLFG